MTDPQVALEYPKIGDRKEDFINGVHTTLQLVLAKRILPCSACAYGPHICSGFRGDVGRRFCCLSSDVYDHATMWTVISTVSPNGGDV